MDSKNGKEERNALWISKVNASGTTAAGRAAMDGYLTVC
jgi:hypothetical protein